jgi:TPR repeat protein
MRISHHIAIAFFFCCLTATAAFAAQPAFMAPDARNMEILQKAADAYDAKDYTRVKQVLKPLVDKNDGYATFAMGLLAARGEGEPRNLKRAESWWRRSADVGNPQAQFNLGYLYFKGALGAQDLTKARKLWALAAKQKHPDALYGMGVLSANGRGGPKEPKAAIKYFEEAAQMGHPLAEYELGQAYLEGKGVPKDRRKARDWFSKAAARGMPEAKNVLQVMDGGSKRPGAKKQPPQRRGNQ